MLEPRSDNAAEIGRFEVRKDKLPIEIMKGTQTLNETCLMFCSQTLKENDPSTKPSFLLSACILLVVVLE